MDPALLVEIAEAFGGLDDGPMGQGGDRSEVLLNDLLDVGGREQLHRQKDVVAIDAELVNRDHPRVVQLVSDFELVPHEADFLPVLAIFAE